jgi:hypothetical protein
MKTKYIGLLGLAVLALVLTGCSKNVKGTYACKGGIFLHGITLESGDKAIVTGNVFGSIQQKIGTYTVDGDNVTITVGGQSTPFLYKDNTLDGGELGGKCVAQ